MASAIRGLAVAAIGVGLVLTGLPAVAAPVTQAAAPAGEIVIPAAARYVPRATRILSAGTTGFLWAQEGDDGLLWTDYATGTPTALAQRLPEKVAYDQDEGIFRSGPSWDPGWYGAGSDTVALVQGSRVTLQQGAGAVTGELDLPGGHTYQGTFGDVVLSRTGAEDEPQAYHLWRAGAASDVTGLPAAATGITVEDGDARSVIVNYDLPGDGNGHGHFSIVDLASGAATPLPDRLDGSDDATEVAGFRLGAGSILRNRWGRYAMDVYDRDDLTATPRTVDTGSFDYQAAYGIVGSTLLTVDPVAPGNNAYRGQPLFSLRVDQADADPITVMSPAAHQIVPTPDGSVLVAGPERWVQYGDVNWGIYKLTQGADGKVQRREVADVAPMPAEVFGLSLGSGVLTTAVNSTVYEPSGYLGAYRSTSVNGAPPTSLGSVGAWVTGHDSSCSSGDRTACVAMFADGGGYYGLRAADYDDVTTLTRSGSSVAKRKVDTGFSSPYLVDLSGRYGVINSGPKGSQAIADFVAGTVVQKRADVPAALWGNTLWSGAAEGGKVTATRIPSTTAAESFTTPNNCTPTELQAVNRWVYWACYEYGMVYGSGVYDRVTKTFVDAPGVRVLLGDGYFVAQSDTGELKLADLTRPGQAARVVGAVDPISGPRVSWTVDRFGGGIAWADQDERVHVVPSGVPASPLSIIDSSLTGANGTWAASWWLSKKASYQLTVRNAYGVDVVSTSGTATQVSASVPNVDGPFSWSLTLQPADGLGAAVTNGVLKPRPPLKAVKAPVITGTAVVGSTLKATLGTWKPAPQSYSYNWAANGVPIPGAIWQSYKLTPGDAGKRLTFTVKTNLYRFPSGKATSAPTAVVAKAAAPRSTKRPVIVGTVKVGRTVAASTGGWSFRPDHYFYEWRLNGKLISTYPKLKLTSAMRGKKLTLTVVARKAGYHDGRATSATATVAK
ncbi:hypothetical protein Ade02nite_75090 [Paractinoplanes deccanensis]|uniref:Uncharacterized protein n=1 Tax=Paractinoplanes deccanensis TaxID=113561 RepID=A0ABQ3YFW3_9ACTN|nr:hypothetical protein [Actinoplanes deccanensis]GID78868.1 hypothetical protein Ade02nite_75090 [Actinoplanes deccanensis]